MDSKTLIFTDKTLTLAQDWFIGLIESIFRSRQEIQNTSLTAKEKKQREAGQLTLLLFLGTWKSTQIRYFYFQLITEDRKLTMAMHIYKFWC